MFICFTDKCAVKRNDKKAALLFIYIIIIYDTIIIYDIIIIYDLIIVYDIITIYDIMIIYEQVL